jgi:hypothetical protein
MVSNQYHYATSPGACFSHNLDIENDDIRNGTVQQQEITTETQKHSKCDPTHVTPATDVSTIHTRYQSYPVCTIQIPSPPSSHHFLIITSVHSLVVSKKGS